jgi:hypothetical protein
VTFGRIASAIGDLIDGEIAMPYRGETKTRNSIALPPCAVALGVAVTERAFEQLEGGSIRLLELSP